MRLAAGMITNKRQSIYTADERMTEVELMHFVNHGTDNVKLTVMIMPDKGFSEIILCNEYELPPNFIFAMGDKHYLNAFERIDAVVDITNALDFIINGNPIT